MKTARTRSLIAHWLSTALLLLLAGCRGNGADQMGDDTAGKQYAITGRVVAIAEDQRSVTLDHEDIAGLMKAMEMKFSVEEPSVLQGIEPEDRVQGTLVVKEGEYIITQLQERQP